MQRAPDRSILRATGTALIAGLIGVGIGIGLPTSTANARSLGPATSEAFELLCVDACPRLVGHTTADGSPIAFEWGARVRLDELDIRIETSGDVHVLTGPILAATSIDLFADRLVRIGNGVQFEVREDFQIKTRTGGRPASGDVRIVPRVRLASREGTSAGGEVELVAGLSSTQLAARILPGLAVSLAGDVFLDLSGARLGRLELRSGGEIHFGSVDVVAVPEPGTALLLGLGLIARSMLRRDARVG